MEAVAHSELTETLSALEALHEDGGESRNGSRLKRRMIERVLTSCERSGLKDADQLLILLRRFVVEAARDDARIQCDLLIGAETKALENLAAA